LMHSEERIVIECEVNNKDFVWSSRWIVHPTVDTQSLCLSADRYHNRICSVQNWKCKRHTNYLPSPIQIDTVAFQPGSINYLASMLWQLALDQYRLPLM
jgi:hypothetical protein